MRGIRLEVKPPRPRGPDAGRRRLGPGRTRARGTGPRFRPQVAELVVRHHDDGPQTHTQHLSMLETVGRWSYVVRERRGRVPRYPRATSPSSIRVRQVPLHLESPKGAACPGPRLSALRWSSLRETHAHARNPRPHRAFRPLLGSSVAASSSSRREGSVPSSPARSGRPPAGMSTAVGSRPRRRFTGRDIETGASARRVPTGMGPGRPNTPDCGTPRRGGRRGVERSLGSRWSARVPGPRNMKN